MPKSDLPDEAPKKESLPSRDFFPLRLVPAPAPPPEQKKWQPKSGSSLVRQLFALSEAIDKDVENILGHRS